MMVGKASVCRLSAPSRHHERFRYSKRPVSPAQRRRAGACIFRVARPIRSYRMNLTMYVITRHHMVVRTASVCRESAETRHRGRNPLLPRHFCAGDNGALGVPESLMVSARSAQSTNGRLTHHQVVSGGDINGLTHPAHPLSRAKKPRCELRSGHFPRESEVAHRSAVTATMPAEGVGLRTKRLSHHRMMQGNV